MASDAATLAVKIEARLDQLEKQLKRAGQMADDTAKDMEKSFEKANDGIAKGFFKGLVAKDIFDKVIQYAKDFLEQLKDIQRTAKLTGQTLQETFAFQRVGQKEGIDPATMQRGMRDFNALLDQASYKSNSLTEIFELNGIKLRNQNGEMITLNQAWSHAADLIQNAATEQQKIDIAKALDIPPEFIPLLEKGGRHLEEIRKKAEEAAPKLDELAEKGKDFERAWNEALEKTKAQFGSWFQSAIGYIFRLDEALQQIRPGGYDWEGLAAKRAMGLGVLGRGDPEAIGPFETDEVRKAIARSRASGGGTSTFDTSRGVTKLPGDKDKAGGGRDTLDAYDREIRRIEETTARMNEETAAINENLYTRTKAVEQKRLEQMLDRAGLELTDARRAQIQQESAAYAEAVVKRAEAIRQQQQIAQLQNFLGQQLVSSIHDMITGAAKLEEILKRVADAILQAALNALILGQGPLAGLFGTAGPAGGSGVGGIIGGLGRMFGFGRQHGGPVRAGGTYLVGESGPELVRFNKSGTVVPNHAIGWQGSEGGMQKLAPVFNIDARGAQAGVAEQITNALRAYDRTLLANLSNKQRRYA